MVKMVVCMVIIAVIAVTLVKVAVVVLQLDKIIIAVVLVSHRGCIIGAVIVQSPLAAVSPRQALRL